MCARCDDLAEELAYLKSEFALQVNGSALGDIQRTLKCQKGDAMLLLALYRARGRVMSTLQLEDAMPSPNGLEDRSANLVTVVVCRARRVVGEGIIETVRGSGYRLTPSGMDLIGRVLGDIEPIPDAVEIQEREPEVLRAMAAMIAGLLAHKDGDGGRATAITFRRIADRLDGKPRIAA